MTHTISQPILAKLQGGILDGDVFELIPCGSIIPPMRFSYLWHEEQSDGEFGCWLNYEFQGGVPEWTLNELIYVYSGKERIGSRHHSNGELP